MSVHYKFKSDRSNDTIAFDGLHISVRDLKKAIFHQKKIGKSTDFDLQITNAHSNEVYTDDNALIPKNSSLIVSRIPLTAQQKKAWEKSAAAQLHLINLNKGESPEHHHSLNNKFSKSADLVSADLSEEDKILAAIDQSTHAYDPSHYVKIKNSNQVGEVPSYYRCYKCLQPGHWIKDCKLNNNQDVAVEIRKSTGIPRSFMIPVEGPQVPGAMMTPMGHFAVPTIDHEARREAPKKQSDGFVVEKPAIPDDLVCGVCKDLLTDAVMIPCCGNSFCDDCIRNVLLESEDHQCPDCKEKDVSPDTLIPSRFLRNSVNNFRNQTGYSRSTPQPAPAQPPQSATQPVQGGAPTGGSQSGMLPVGQAVVGDQPGGMPHSGPPTGPHMGPGMMPQGGPRGPNMMPHGQPMGPMQGMPPLNQPPPLMGSHPMRPHHPPPHHPNGPPLHPNGPPHRAIPPLMPPHFLQGQGPRPTHHQDKPSDTSSPSQPVTIEVPDGDDDSGTSSPPAHNVPPPASHVGSRPTYTSSYRGRGRGEYNSDWRGGGRGYHSSNIRPLMSVTQTGPSLPPPPHLHFTQGGGYVFQPVTSGSYREGSDRDYYRGKPRPLETINMPPNGDPLEIFEKFIKEKDSRKKERARSRSYSRSRSRSPRWSPVRSPRSRTPKARSRSPKARSRSPKPRSPMMRRTPPLKRSPKRSPPPKPKMIQRPRSRTPVKRSLSRSRSRSPPPYPKRRSRSPSKTYSYSRSRSRSPSELRRPLLRRERKRSIYSRSPPPGTGRRSPPPGTAPLRSPPRTYYGERKYKAEPRPYQPGPAHTKPAVRSSVYKPHDYQPTHQHSRYDDRESRYDRDRDYGPPPSRHYPPKPSYNEHMDYDSKMAGEWERIRDREISLRRMESNYEPEKPTYVIDRRERDRALSATKIIKDLHERDKEKDRIHEREQIPLSQFEALSPDSFKDSPPEKERKSKKEKKKKREDSDKKKKKKRKEKKVVEEDAEEEDDDDEPAATDNKEEDLLQLKVQPHPEPTPLVEPTIAEPIQTIDKPIPVVVKQDVKQPSPQKQIFIPLIDDKPEEKSKAELFNADDLYKDLGAAVDMKPFETAKQEEPVVEAKEPPSEKPAELPEETVAAPPAEVSPEKDVMLAPVPELSKWEKDEDILLSQNDTRPMMELELTVDPSDRLLDESDDHDQQVTSEVLKRAENAIFKRGVISKDVAKPPEKKDKIEKEHKKEKDEKKELEEKRLKEEKLREREEKLREREERKEREREERRRERELRKEAEKREKMLLKEQPVHPEPPYYREEYPVRPLVNPMAADMEESSRHRKERIVVPRKEKRISAKERLGAKVDDKALRRDIKYGKIPRSDQEVVSRVIHGDHHNHRERKVVSLKEDGKKRKGSAEGYVYEISDEERLERLAESSKRRSESADLLPPQKKKSKHEESSEEASSDESTESPKKHKKKKKSKKKKKEKKKKSKAKHESSSDSASSSSSSESESEDEKKKKKHKHKSRKKSKKHKKSKK